jgi:hypothetical protein
LFIDRLKEAPQMPNTTRRSFLSAAAATGAVLALDRAPALAQKKELTFLSVNHFVPASDEELRKQAEAFGKQAGVSVRVDTIAGLQLPAKRAAEERAASQRPASPAGGSFGGLGETGAPGAVEPAAIDPAQLPKGFEKFLGQ